MLLGKLNNTEDLKQYAVSFFRIYAFQEFIRLLRGYEDTRWRSWLRHCATSREVAGSIPDSVIGIFH
jgi:hypothetical protein